MFVSDPLPSFHSVSSSFGRPSLTQSNTPIQSYNSSILERTRLHVPQINLAIAEPSEVTDSSPASRAQDNERFHDETSFPFQSGQPSSSRDLQEDSYILSLCGVNLDRGTSPNAPNQSRSALRSDRKPYEGQASTKFTSRESCKNDFEYTGGLENHLSKGSALGFGSDAGFQSQRYAPPPSLEDSQIIEGRVLKVLEGLEEAQTSSAYTQSSSPVIPRLKRRCSGAILDTSEQGAHVRANDAYFEYDGKGVGGKRRRRSKNHDHKGPITTPSKLKVQSHHPRKARSDTKVRSSSDEGRWDQHRPHLGDHKSSRQNLTEEEKKQNHIKSEQKRRNQIKEGFDALMELIPDGMSAATSKCAILSKAAEWLSDLIDGNERLRAQLAALDRNIV